MPANEASLRISDLYAAQLRANVQRAIGTVRQAWAGVSLERLEPSFKAWSSTSQQAIALGQRQGAQLTLAYFSAYLTSELGHPVRVPSLDTTKHVGLAEDGRSLSVALAAALVAVKVGLSGEQQDEPTVVKALASGLARATRQASLGLMAAPRETLSEGMQTDGRIAGWKRRLNPPSCGACIAAADGETNPVDQPLKHHPFCDCLAEMAVDGLEERAPRPTGPEIFNALTPVEQDDLLGFQKAALLRAGAIDFSDLIAHSPIELGPDFITEAPLEALAVS